MCNETRSLVLVIRVARHITLPLASACEAEGGERVFARCSKYSWSYCCGAWVMLLSLLWCVAMYAFMLAQFEAHVQIHHDVTESAHSQGRISMETLALKSTMDFSRGSPGRNQLKMHVLKHNIRAPIRPHYV